jgi:hypothetical protein
MKPPAFWHSKSNSFTLLLIIDEYRDRLNKIQGGALEELRKSVESFAMGPPEEYALAAKEGVNNKKERTIRYTHIKRVVEKVFGVPAETRE